MEVLVDRGKITRIFFLIDKGFQTETAFLPRHSSDGKPALITCNRRLFLISLREEKPEINLAKKP